MIQAPPLALLARQTRRETRAQQKGGRPGATAPAPLSFGQVLPGRCRSCKQSRNRWAAGAPLVPRCAALQRYAPASKEHVPCYQEKAVLIHRTVLLVPGNATPPAISPAARER